MALELWSYSTGEVHEVVADDAHDMEAVGYDPGVGEVAADDIAVGAGEIDTNYPDLVASAQCPQIGGQVRHAPAGPDVKDAVVAKVAECGAEALPLVQGVLVDTKVLRALERKPFAGFAACELGVDPADGGSS